MRGSGKTVGRPCCFGRSWPSGIRGGCEWPCQALAAPTLGLLGPTLAMPRLVWDYWDLWESNVYDIAPV